MQALQGGAGRAHACALVGAGITRTAVGAGITRTAVGAGIACTVVGAGTRFPPWRSRAQEHPLQLPDWLPPA